LLLGDFGTPPTPAEEVYAACTTPILAMKLDVLLHGSWNVFMLIVVIETHTGKNGMFLHLEMAKK